jgi:hypothetical protein
MCECRTLPGQRWYLLARGIDGWLEWSQRSCRTVVVVVVVAVLCGSASVSYFQPNIIIINNNNVLLGSRSCKP